MKKEFSVKIPATSANLGPGFDCLGVALGLYNTIRVILLDKNDKTRIIVRGNGKRIIPENGNNLVYRIIKDLLEKNRRACPAMELVLENNIPVARGLGSSAAAIVGALSIANEILGKKYSVEELIAKAVKIEGHADNIVPAFVGGLCITRIDNGYIPWWKEKVAHDLRACVCIPEFIVMTKKARKLVPLQYSRKTSIFTTSGAAFFIAAVTSQTSFERNAMIRKAMEDKFHQPYRKCLVSGMEAVFRSAQKAGALGAALSGSGPSIIALVSKKSNNNRIGQAMVDTFKRNGIKSTYQLLAFDQRGVQKL